MHIIDQKRGTLKEASYDKEHDIYMVESELEVCLFDSVKEWYVSEYTPLANPNPKSNDALVITEEESCFIEFKNGKIDNRVNYELNKKIHDSLFILFDLGYVDPNGRRISSISYTRQNMDYILVYNEEKNLEAGFTRQTLEGFERQKVKVNKSKHRDKLFSAVRGLANEELIKFGLDQYKNYLFKDVHTYTVNEFEEKFLKRQNENVS